MHHELSNILITRYEHYANGNCDLEGVLRSNIAVADRDHSDCQKVY